MPGHDSPHKWAGGQLCRQSQPVGTHLLKQGVHSSIPILQHLHGSSNQRQHVDAELGGGLVCLQRACSVSVRMDPLPQALSPLLDPMQAAAAHTVMPAPPPPPNATSPLTGNSPALPASASSTFSNTMYSSEPSVNPWWPSTTVSGISMTYVAPNASKGGCRRQGHTDTPGTADTQSAGHDNKHSRHQPGHGVQQPQGRAQHVAASLHIQSQDRHARAGCHSPGWHPSWPVSERSRKVPQGLACATCWVRLTLLMALSRRCGCSSRPLDLARCAFTRLPSGTHPIKKPPANTPAQHARSHQHQG